MKTPRRASRVPDGGVHRRSEELRFKHLVDSVLDYAIFLLTPDGVVETWNHGARRLKGYRDEEIIGQHYSVFYPPESLEVGLPHRLLQQARDEGRVHHSGWRLRKDGSRFWADVVITSLHDTSGALTGFAKVTRDMTEMRDAQEAREAALAEQRAAVERLEELDRWRREFMAAVVHDLQTPVTAVTGFVQLLRDGAIPAEDHDAILGRVLSNAGALQELIHNLRSYSLLSENTVDLRPRPVPLRAFLIDLLADLAPLLVEHPVTSALDDIEVVADPHALGRILRNLLANAARHTPPGTSVRIVARAADGDVQIAVEDDGQGIPNHLLPRIFDRFERGRSGGTGLGLSIVQQYAELQGGQVAVDSSPGRGTRFTVTLPGRQRRTTPHGGAAVSSIERRPGEVLSGEDGPATARDGSAATATVPATLATSRKVVAADIDPFVVGLVHETTRRLLHLGSVADAGALLEQFVLDLGGSVIDAADAGNDHLPIDLSFGLGVPRVPAADDPHARLRLEFALPGLVEDARRAVDLLRADGGR